MIDYLKADECKTGGETGSEASFWVAGNPFALTQSHARRGRKYVPIRGILYYPGFQFHIETQVGLKNMF